MTEEAIGGTTPPYIVTNGNRIYSTYVVCLIYTYYKNTQVIFEKPGKIISINEG